MKTFFIITFLFVFSSTYAQKFENLAMTPPMGWNSWNKFGCNVSEKLIMEIADAMVKTGMKDAGYEYVVIDDCWQVDRDSNGNIIADPVRFPSGIKSLADYIHSLGLKFGIYSDAGLKTCQKRPGSRGYEFQDARTYAKWEVDYLKYDWCNHGTQNPQASYEIMRDALYKAGRPIILSICEWGSNKPWLWARDIGHLWRTTEDILDCWGCRTDWGGMGWPMILDKQVGLEVYSGPGHWNDPDMLQVGNDSLTISESRAHFSLWCILAAPLMAGNDIRNMSNETLEILTNKEIIVVDQDPLGKPGIKVRDDGDVEVWSKQLSDGSRAVVLFNRGSVEKEISVKWEELGYPGHLEANVRDLWKRRDIEKFKGKFTAKVQSHDVVMVKINP